MSWVEWAWAIVTAPLIVLAMLAVSLWQRGVSPRLLLCAAGLHRWKPVWRHHVGSAMELYVHWALNYRSRNASPWIPVGHRCRRCGARRPS